jgi:hypothetical protein
MTKRGTALEGIVTIFQKLVFWFFGLLVSPSFVHTWQVGVCLRVWVSAASKRGFSTMGFIHSKSRNRLGPEKVKKLTFCLDECSLTHRRPSHWRPRGCGLGGK